jgi:NAD(P)-dependent dehydrogenase (short-subunit alcohol dehydrogenase family)
MSEFSKKVVLITGAGRGHGREIALAFASLGATIAANDINPINLDVTVDQIKTLGGIAEAFVFDIAKRMPIEGMVSQVLDRFGRIDILVNHASVQPNALVIDMDEWEFHRTIDVNLAGPFFNIQQVGRVMREQEGGSIINLISAYEPGNLPAGHSAYFASQAALVGLTQAAASELRTHHIRVNAVCQGAFGFGQIPLQDWDEHAYLNWLDSFPGVNPRDVPRIVSLVLYLCSQEARSLTGQIITV